MSEFKVAQEGDEIVIRVKKNAPLARSASGKSLVVATSNGNHPTTLEVEGKPVTVGFNLYISAK